MSRYPAAPADFAAYAPGKTFAQLMKRYSVGWRTVTRWRNETGTRGYDPSIDPFVRRYAYPLPDDFREIAAITSDRALGRHYGRDHKTIKRWRREVGIPSPGRRKIVDGKPSKPAVTLVRPTAGNVALPARSLQRAPLITGREAEAAQHLRRFYPAVYRCAEGGRADPKGEFWRIGNTVMKPSELVAKAHAKGWDPEAWRRVA